MQFTISTIALIASLASAAPSSSLEERQGGAFVSVGLKYSAGGCTDQSVIFADPIFGNGNVCQPLSRNAGAVPIVSYKTLSVSPGCSVKLYTDLACSVPASGFDAGVDGCVQGSAPFQSVFVTCP